MGVQVIEFESNAMMVGHLGLRVSLIAYPVVSVKKVRLRPCFQFLRLSSPFHVSVGVVAVHNLRNHYVF